MDFADLHCFSLIFVRFHWFWLTLSWLCPFIDRLPRQYIDRLPRQYTAQTLINRSVMDSSMTKCIAAVLRKSLQLELVTEIGPFGNSLSEQKKTVQSLLITLQNILLCFHQYPSNKTNIVPVSENCWKKVDAWHQLRTFSPTCRPRTTLKPVFSSSWPKTGSKKQGGPVLKLFHYPNKFTQSFYKALRVPYHSKSRNIATFL